MELEAVLRVDWVNRSEAVAEGVSDSARNASFGKQGAGLSSRLSEEDRRCEALTYSG